MNPLKRYIWNPLVRHRRGKGFGIHSPHAFTFVMGVLCERGVYYAFAPLRKMQRVVEADYTDAPGYAEATLLFRVTNYLNPTRIAMIGSGHGLLEAACLLVNSQSTLTSIGNDENDTIKRLLSPFSGRISNSLSADEPPQLVVVNSVPQGKAEAAVQAVFATIDACGALVVRNIHSSEPCARLWQVAKKHMTCGQSFTNNHTAVIIANAKLPLQHFSLKF